MQILGAVDLLEARILVEETKGLHYNRERGKWAHMALMTLHDGWRSDGYTPAGYGDSLPCLMKPRMLELTLGFIASLAEQRVQVLWS